jgi:hypothetical protein
VWNAPRGHTLAWTPLGCVEIVAPGDRQGSGAVNFPPNRRENVAMLTTLSPPPMLPPLSEPGTVGKLRKQEG